jgi:hypothetical protein
MSDSRATEGTDVWQFAIALQALCPAEFYGELRAIDWAIKLTMRNGGTLLVWFRKGGFVSRLSCESAAPPKAVLDALAAQVRGKLVGFNMRPALLKTIEAWRAIAAEPASVQAAAGVEKGGGPAPVMHDRQGGASADDDPIGAVVASGTIGVRKGGAPASARSATGAIGVSGWSQEIGRRCEQIAFQAICDLCGEHCVRIEGVDTRARLRLASGERVLDWINAAGERGNSWDIEERDAATGAVVRRHEVKAPTAQLTALEHALALRFGANYVVWRVDPDTGSCTRLSVRELASSAQQFIRDGGTASQTTSQPAPTPPMETQDGAPTMVVLGSSTREFCRKLRRQHHGCVGRFRGNLVVAFKVTPELEAQLPPSASKVWITNRSRAGCERLIHAIRLVEAATFTAPRVGMLLVGLRISSPHGTARALTGAVSAAR